MNDLQLVALNLNICVKVLLAVVAYHFYTVGDMFLAGLFLGWIVLEVFGILILVASVLAAILWR